MPDATLRMVFADAATLTGEFENNLKHGRAFVAGASGVEVLADCVLVLVHPSTHCELPLAGQAVLVSNQPNSQGVGIQLRPFDATVLHALQDFIAAPSADDAVRPQGPGAAELDEVETASLDELCASDDDDADHDDPAAGSELQKNPLRHEQLRKISQTEQQKVARTGDLHDRVILERLYGKGVWEGLLRNPKLTIPEVARIARKGTVPRPLLEVILDQAGWIQSALVRRALLSNPRITGEGILKLLRITPKHELRQITKTTTYSTAVRDAARKVLDV